MCGPFGDHNINRPIVKYIFLRQQRKLNMSFKSEDTKDIINLVKCGYVKKISIY